MKISKISLYTAVALVIGLVFISISGCCCGTCSSRGQSKVSNAEAVALCSACGQVEGSDLCCK